MALKSTERCLLQPDREVDFWSETYFGHHFVFNCIGTGEKSLRLPQAASSRISRTCAGPLIGRGLRGTHGVPIACSAIMSKLSGPILTAPRLRGMPSPL